MIEFERTGGTKKLKQVARQDFNEGSKIVREMVTYDIPQLFKKTYKDLMSKRK